MGLDYKRFIIGREHDRITIGRQCELLGISISSCYYKKVINPEKEHCDECVKALISEIYCDHPYYGKRRIQNELAKRGVFISSYKVKSLMDKLGISAIYPKPNLSKPKKENRKYPYLLRNIPITHANQVLSTDITYIKNGSRICLSGGGNRLVQPLCSVVEDLDHFRKRILLRCPA
ncbi:IS3 family transposase [bacterium]|nr:IS3 family transposase [bacterium]